MTMKMLTYCVVMVLFFSGCSSQNKACFVCGDFNLISFNKSEINSIQEKDVTAMRNLNLGEEVGMDHFTIWYWNEGQPDSAWTESFEKEIDLSHGQLSIKSNGTWNWALKTTEVFKSSPFFGEGNYVVEKEQIESGVWRYINDNHQFVELETRENEINGQANIIMPNVSDEIMLELPFQDHQKFTDMKRTRRFEITYLQAENRLELKTLDNYKQIALEDIACTSYSLTEGHIVMTLSTHQKMPKLAAKLK